MILDVTCIDQILFGDRALTLRNINISLDILNLKWYIGLV
uniref:Uncharacterized protein n=1 Tax=Musa acuminata subsp. malaccensis TaxID=214687 RepID=A0A804L1B8_MUSAM